MRLSTCISTLLLVTSAHAWSARAVFAQDARTTQEAESAVHDAETLRQRWERLSPEEQKRMREHFEELRSMTKEERHELMLRARRLREARSRLQEEWPADVRERLDTLTPDERRLLLDDLAREETREFGRHIRGKLPRELVRRLETMPPEERAQAIARFKEVQRERSERALQDMSRRLGLSREEVERIEQLHGEERMRALLGLRKRLAASGEEDQAVVRPEVQRGLRELREAARPRADDLFTDHPLTPHERRERLFAARRDRCLAVLRETKLLAPDEIDELAKVPMPWFFPRMRDLVAPLDPRQNDPRQNR